MVFCFFDAAFSFAVLYSSFAAAAAAAAACAFFAAAAFANSTFFCFGFGALSFFGGAARAAAGGTLSPDCRSHASSPSLSSSGDGQSPPSTDP